MESFHSPTRETFLMYSRLSILAADIRNLVKNIELQLKDCTTKPHVSMDRRCFKMYFNFTGNQVRTVCQLNNDLDMLTQQIFYWSELGAKCGIMLMKDHNQSLSRSS